MSREAATHFLSSFPIPAIPELTRSLSLRFCLGYSHGFSWEKFSCMIRYLTHFDFSFSRFSLLVLPDALRVLSRLIFNSATVVARDSMHKTCRCVFARILINSSGHNAHGRIAVTLTSFPLTLSSLHLSFPFSLFFAQSPLSHKLRSTMLETFPAYIL